MTYQPIATLHFAARCFSDGPAAGSIRVTAYRYPESERDDRQFLGRPMSKIEVIPPSGFWYPLGEVPDSVTDWQSLRDHVLPLLIERYGEPATDAEHIQALVHHGVLS